MRIVFMGTPQFAASILEKLADTNQVVGAFTQPDAIRSRGKKLEPSPVKKVARSREIPTFEYATFKDNDAYDALAALMPDVVCVAAYGVLLPARVIDLPRFGCLNVHGSLLPRWRGAAPIERAILAGDNEVGVCIMQMEPGLDTGAYCLTRSIPQEDRSASELTEVLASLGAEALIEALSMLDAGELEWTVQDESLVTYAHKIEKGELDIAPSQTIDDALRAIRASSENHPSKVIIGGKDVTLVSAVSAQDQFEVRPGQVAFIAKKLYLGLSDGAIELLEVHPSGKKRMSARDFASGLQGVKQGQVSWSAYEH